MNCISEEYKILDDGRIQGHGRIWDLNNEDSRIDFWWHNMVRKYGVGTGRWPIEEQIQARLLEYPELKKEIDNDEYDWYDAEPKKLLDHINWWIQCKYNAEDNDLPLKYYHLND